MARHSGKNGIVKIDSGAIVALTGWDINEGAETHDITACGDVAEDHDVGFTNWSGSIRMNLDHAAAGQTLRAGAVVDFEGYTEGDAVGRTYYSGEISIESMSITSDMRSVVTREYSFKGKGLLTVATVTG